MQQAPTFETTTVRIHPAAARYIDNHFPRLSDSYDLRGSHLQPFLSALLSKSAHPFPSHHCKRTGQMKEVKLVISGWDCEHFGNILSDKSQLAFSQHIHKLLLREACHEILVAHVVGGLPRDTAIKNHLVRNLYEDSELNYAALRKHYQRHWAERERQFAEDWRQETQTTHKRH